MSNQPVLFDYWRSTSSYRVRIALALKNIEYKRIKVDLLGGEHRQEEFQSRNPQGLVPVLEIDGKSLIQSLAIIEYLDEVYPNPPLLDTDPHQRARVRSLSHSIAMEIHPICNPKVVRYMSGHNSEEDAKSRWMRHFISTGLEAFERLVSGERSTKFCCGESISMADCCLVPQVYNARRWGVDIGHLDRILSIEEACKSIPAFIEAHPDISPEK